MIKNKPENEIKRGDTLLAVKAGMWYVLSTFLAKSISFITTPIFSRLMSPADFGEFSNFASWKAILIIITSLEVYNTLNRAYYDFKEDYDSYVSTVTWLGFATILIFYLIFLCLKKGMLQVISIPEEYIHLLFFSLFFASSQQLYLARERTLYKYKTVAKLSVFTLIVPTLIAVFFVWRLPETDKLAARLYGTYIPLAIVGAYCTIRLLKFKNGFKLKYCKYAIALAIPLVAHYLTAYLLTSTNTIIAKNTMGAETAAIVSISGSTIHILTVFLQAVSGAVTTWLMDNLEQKNVSKVRKGSAIYVAIIAIVAISVILVAPEVVYILGGKEYMQATVLIPGLVFAVFLQSSATIFTIILTYDKNVVKTAVFSAIVAMLSVMAKIKLSASAGVIVLSSVNAMAFGVLFVINYLLIRKAGYGEYFSLRASAPTIALVGIFVLISPLLYTYSGARLFIIVAMVFVATVTGYIKRREIKKYIKQIRKK